MHGEVLVILKGIKQPGARGVTEQFTAGAEAEFAALGATIEEIKGKAIIEASPIFFITCRRVKPLKSISNFLFSSSRFSFLKISRADFCNCFLSVAKLINESRCFVEANNFISLQIVNQQFIF